MSAPYISKNKIIIGLTGNIATGKSAVMRLAAAEGALTIDADKVVHEVLNGDTAVQQAISTAFGPTVQLPDGRINRPTLGQIVFNDPQALKQLETAVHPAVHHRIFQLINESTTDVVMIEAIKLLEGKLHTICRQIWVTTCTRETQLARLQVCRGMDVATAVARIDAQSPQAKKIVRADVVIDTNGLLQDTKTQFKKAWAQRPQV